MKIRKLYRWSMSMAVIASLGACSLAPPYERPAPPVSQTRAPSSDSESEQLRSPSAIPWDVYFTDPDLREIVALALENNRDLRQAVLNVERMQAAYRIERSAALPNLTLGGSGERSRIPADLSTTGQSQTLGQYGVNLGIVGWELDFFGRIRNLKSAALEQYFSSEEARRASHSSVVAAVAWAYLSLAADREALDLATATLTTQRESMDLIRQSRDLGIADDLQLSQARSQVEASEVRAVQLRGFVEMDRNALDLIVGAPVPERLLPERLGGVTSRALLPSGLSSEVLLDRPDILAAEHQLKAAHANIGAARASRFPRISLTTTAGTLSREVSGLFEGGSGSWTFAPSVTIPIFSAGRLAAAVDVTQIDRELALNTYEMAIQRAFREVADALVLDANLDEQLAAQQRLVDALDESFRFAQARWKEGLDSYLTVLVAERSLYAARDAMVESRRMSEANKVTLFKVFGGGVDQRQPAAPAPPDQPLDNEPAQEPDRPR